MTHEIKGAETPAFVLTADDPLAPILTQLWAHLAAESGHVSQDAVTDAICCAGRMRVYRTKKEYSKTSRAIAEEILKIIYTSPNQNQGVPADG